MIKTREQIIASMCLTYRHDYWLIKESKNFLGGMTEEERKSLYNQMAKIFDNDIAPYMTFKSIDNNNLLEGFDKLKAYIANPNNFKVNNPNAIDDSY